MYCSHHDHRHVRKSFFGFLQEANSVKVGHHQVGEHQLELFTGIKQRQGLHAGPRLAAVEVSAGKHRRHNLADCLLIIYYQDTLGGHGACSVYGVFYLTSEIPKVTIYARKAHW